MDPSRVRGEIKAIVSSLVSAYRAIVRPISLSVLLVACLHLAIGALALRALVHPAAPHVAATASKPATPTKPTTAVAQVKPATPSAPAPKVAETEPLRSHATILDSVLL